MENSTTTTKKSFSLDWLVGGTLSKVGEMFDKLTGRHWQPSSSLATSELIERLKKLLDREARDLGGERGRFVPHNIKLLMQWDKFSTDAEHSLKKLENELTTAAVDHINDRRYHTYAPLKFEIKPDYFTEGVKLLASFDEFAKGEGEEEEEQQQHLQRQPAEMNVTIPDLKNVILNAPEAVSVEPPPREIFTARFTVHANLRQIDLAFAEKQRLSVGRAKENDLWLDDASVSKIHASLALNAETQLTLADTGSTNGTFVNEDRIAYGKAITINDGDKVKFGTIEVVFERQKQFVEAAENFSTNEDLNVESFDTNDDFETNRDLKTNQNFKTSEDVIDEPKIDESKNDLSLNERKMNVDLTENKN